MWYAGELGFNKYGCEVALFRQVQIKQQDAGLAARTHHCHLQIHVPNWVNHYYCCHCDLIICIAT